MRATTRTAPPRSTRPRWPRGLEESKQWITDAIDLQQRARRRRRRRQEAASHVATPRRSTTPTSIYAAVKDLGRRPSWSRSCRSPTRPSAPPPRAPCATRSSSASSRLSSAFAEGDRRRRRAGHQAAQGGVPVADQVDRAHAHRQRRRPHRRSWPPRPPSALRRGRRPPDRARLRPVPAWRDPGPQRRHPGHGEDGPDDRRHRPDRRRKRYMHHYNFPPFSTGETGFMRGPKRREIGHGAPRRAGAASRSSRRSSEFPYTIRLVSEVLASNGSTSMASVCGSTLSLMDAGVPIKAPVAGIAMGLVYADGKYTTLTDILGAEDAFGDMDFKVAGTADFVTALQLDTKIDGIPADVLAAALDQAKEARLAILEVMADGHRRAPQRGVAETRRRSSASRSRSTRSARSSARRARSSTPSRPRPAPTSPSTTTAWSGIVAIAAVDARCGGRGRAPDPAHPQPADGGRRRRSTRAGS